MSLTNNRPNADASLRGDDKPMPMQGTVTGMDPSGFQSTDGGMSLDGDATNSLGGMGSMTKSDPWADAAPSDPAYADGGDTGYSPDIHGTPMDGTKSDPPDEDEASPSTAGTSTNGPSKGYY